MSYAEFMLKANDQHRNSAVTPEYLDWLESIYPRFGVSGNEAWNAGVAWAMAQKQEQGEPETMTDKKLLEQTLEDLKSVLTDHDGNVCWQGSYADRDIIGNALYEFEKLIAAQPKAEQEPVVRYFEQWQASPLEEVDDERFNKLPESVRFKLYEAPQQRKPLTMFDTEKLAKQCGIEWTVSIDKLCNLAAANHIKE